MPWEDDGWTCVTNSAPARGRSVLRWSVAQRGKVSPAVRLALRELLPLLLSLSRDAARRA